MQRLMLFCFAMFFMAGCLLPQTMTMTESRLKAVESENLALKSDIKRLRETGESDKRALRSDLAALRSDFAALRADFNSLREELQELRGKIEETGHEIEQLRGRITEADKARQENMYALSSGLLERIAAIEHRLGMGRGRDVEPGRGDKAGQAAGNGLTAKEDEKAGKDRSRVSDKRLYEFARQAFNVGDYNAARKSFKELMERFPDSELCDNARFWIGESYFREKWYEKAILEYQKVVDDYPKGNKAPAALLKQGMAFHLIGKDKEARLVFEKLMKLFPDSSDARAAQQKLKALSQ